MSYSTLRDMPIRMRRCRKRKSPLIRLAPRSVFVEERERLIDEVTIKLLAHVVLDVARHADQNAALQKKKKPADQTCTEDFTGGDREFRPGQLSPVRVDRLADDEWNKKSGSYAAEDTRDADR